MKLDTHVHFLVDKGVAHRLSELRLMTDAAHAQGLELLCITEHRDATFYGDMLRAVFHDGVLGGQRVADGVWRLESGLVLTSGAEVAIRGGGDVGVHASTRVLSSLDGAKGAYSVSELLDALESSGEPFVAVAHHLFWAGKWMAEVPREAHRLHAIEVPGKDSANSARYRELARVHALGVTSGSDSHTWVQLGAGSTRADLSVPQFFASFRDSLRARSPEAVLADDAPGLVRLSSVYRKHLREVTAGARS